MEGPPAALRPSRHQDAGAHSGPTRLPIVTGKGETAVIDPHAKDISGRPEVFDETHLAAVRAYVGQDRYIDGTFDPLTCTLTKERDPGAAPEPAPEPEPEPEPKPVMTEAQLAKLERNRKKRAKKKAKKRAAKSQAEAGAMVTPNAAANGKIFGSEQGVEREGWHSATMHHKSPTDVREDKPLGKADYLRGMGFGRREREKIATFERLTRLTGLADTLRDDGMCASIGGQLEKFVVEAGQVDTIHACALRRRGSVSPASAGGFDTHRVSITCRLGRVGGAGGHHHRRAGDLRQAVQHRQRPHRGGRAHHQVPSPRHNDRDQNV
jgi:hypothetical protein